MGRNESGREAPGTLGSIELFVGAGGLGMGIEQAGFEHELVVDWDRHACDTIRDNQAASHPAVAGWPLRQCDVRELDFRSLGPGVDLVSGGPPCQPFSLGGKHHGPLDKRDMFPEAIRAVRELSPKAFIFENVRGLWRPAFSRYLEYIRDHLTFPELTTRADESWLDHASRLRQHCNVGSASRYKDLEYRTSLGILNAADFGVPQKRERMIMVGIRADLNINWSFPKPTHSPDALLWDKWISGAYWDRHRIAKKDHPAMPDNVCRRVERLRGFNFPPPLEPWRTVRDAIAELPDPEFDPIASQSVLNHQFNPGARAYPGHTGSTYDEPAKVLKAGDHGVPGGENMLARGDGTCRYFSVREAARLQTFSDSYRFPGSWTETMRQIGNAVPVVLGRVLADSVRECLDGSTSRRETAVANSDANGAALQPA